MPRKIMQKLFVLSVLLEKLPERAGLLPIFILDV